MGEEVRGVPEGEIMQVNKDGRKAGNEIEHKIEILDQSGAVKASAGGAEVRLVYRGVYEPGGCDPRDTGGGAGKLSAPARRVGRA